MAAHHTTALFRGLSASCARAWVVAAPLLVATACVQAQMVPRAGNAWREYTSDNLSTARISWSAPTETPGNGLNAQGQGLWPHWEGRIGVVIDRPVNPLKDSFVLAQPAQAGLRVRSMHVLSDYYLDGGFRATAGLVRGETSQAWWSSGDNGGGLNLSLQRLDTLGLMGSIDSRARVASQDRQTSPYIGAGYSTRLNVRSAPNPWRFNADLGLITINSNNIGRITQVLQGDRGIEDLARDLRLRTIVKVSVGYAF